MVGFTSLRRHPKNIMLILQSLCWMDSFVSLRCHPNNSLYTMPFKSKRSLLLSFLLLVCLRKQAFDTASKQKTRHIRDRLCREEGIRTLDTLPYTHFPGVLLQPLGHLSIFLSCVRPFFRCIPMARFSN